MKTWTWWSSGDVEFTVGMLLDGPGVMMLFVVTLISLLVHVYSTDYVGGDRRYTHYFAFLSLFSASMLGLIMSESTLQLLTCWELVGLCSFALIGHWWEEKPNSDAALKAFITNRVGDVGPDLRRDHPVLRRRPDLRHPHRRPGRSSWPGAGRAAASSADGPRGRPRSAPRTSGQTNRTIARMRRQRCGVRFHSLASGVPSKGIRKLTGTESGSSSRSEKTTSTRSSSLSPMPAISPEQADRPAACACCTVSTRSA